MDSMRPGSIVVLFSGFPIKARPAKRDEVPSQELGRDLVTEGDGLVSIHRIETDIRERRRFLRRVPVSFPDPICDFDTINALHFCDFLLQSSEMRQELLSQPMKGRSLENRGYQHRMSSRSNRNYIVDKPTKSSFTAKRIRPWDSTHQQH